MYFLAHGYKLPCLSEESQQFSPSLMWRQWSELLQQNKQIHIPDVRDRSWWLAQRTAFQSKTSTSCLAYPFWGKGSSLGALVFFLLPHSPLLAANTQLFGYLSGASIKGCHSASRCPWANQIRAADHTQPSPRCSPAAMLITFKYSHRWPALSWKERDVPQGGN